MRNSDQVTFYCRETQRDQTHEREREGHLPMGERLDRDKVIGLRHHERGKGERKMGGSKVGEKQNGLHDGSGEEE